MSGGNKTISTSDVRLGGLQIQNTGYGVCIPILYGTNRAKPNLIEYTNFIATPHTTTSSAGGKGGGVTTSNTTFSYTAAVILGICEGPVAAFGRLWLDKNSPVAPSQYGLSMFGGGYPQTPWSWMTTYNPSRAIGYQGIAYAACGNYSLGSNASIGNHSFEVTGTGTLQNGYDVNAIGVIADFLNNANYGAMFPYLGDTTSAWNYCQANGVFISPILDTQQPAQQWLTQFAKIANAGLVWSSGLLKIVPYGDQAITGNGATYTPNITPIYDLTDDDFQGGNGDPVTVTRKRQADAFNSVQVEYLNRDNYYNIEPATVTDMANIEAYGLRAMASVSLHEICVPTVAKQVAQAFLQRELYVRNTYTFILTWKYCLLEPMDVVSLTDVALGLSFTPVRIVSIEENYDGLLTVTAEEMPYGVSQPAHYPHTGGTGYSPSNNVTGGPVNTPVIFEPPNVMSAPNLEVWMAVSGGTDWGGCNVWVSEDNATYRNIGKITSPARHGVLTASLAGGVDPDTTHTLSVDMSASRSQLLSGTQADADSLKTLMWVDGELMSYQNATLTAAYHYDLTYLRRGVDGTAIGVHAVNSQFARLDDAIFKYVVPVGMVGLPVWVKFASFNSFGGGVQSLADCAAYNYTILGNRPVGLTAITATGGMFLNDLSWTFGAVQRDRDYTEIVGSTTNDRSTATTLTASKSPTANWKHTGLTPAQNWYYWARTVDNSGNTSDWYPTSATGGVACAPSADPSALLTQLNSSLGLAQLTSALAQPITAVSWDALNTAMNLAGTQVSTIGNQLAGISMISNEQVSRVRMQASLGDSLAAVVAQATALGANLTLKVQSNGAFAAMSLDAPAGGAGSSVVFETDKFAICKPDGTGSASVFFVGTINGVSSVGINGNLIVDGTIVARSIAAGSITGTQLALTGGLSALTADLGSITSGKIQNSGNTNFVDLNATGSQPFVKVGSNITIDAAGNATFNGVVLSRNMVIATGTTLAGTVFDSYSVISASSVVDTGISVSAWSPNASYIVVTNLNSAGGVGLSGAYYPPYPEITTYGQVMHGWRWATASTIKLRITAEAALPGNVYTCTIYGGVAWTLYKVT